MGGNEDKFQEGEEDNEPENKVETEKEEIKHVSTETGTELSKKKDGGEDKMPTNRKKGKSKTETEDTTNVSLMDLKEEFDDTLFEGTISYLGLQKQYIEKPKEEYMTVTEFEKKIEEFKKQKIYKEEVDQEGDRL